MNFWRILAFLILLLHALWLAWVLVGWIWTRRRPLLRWLHIGSLTWGIFVSFFPICPLTDAEMYFQRRAGLTPDEKSFIERAVELLVYPNVDPNLVMWAAAGICVAILLIYVVRYRNRGPRGW